MAATASLIRQGFLVLAVTLISLTSSHRLQNHPYLKSIANVTLWTSTTPGSTEKVVIDDKMPGPSVKYPSSGQAFLDYLLNRDTYFEKAGSGSKSSTGSSVTNSSPTTELTSTSTDPTTTRPETTSETTVAKTSPTDSTSTTTRTSTTARNTSGRPDQLPFNNEPQAQDRDRLSRYQLADRWLQRFRRPSVLEPRVRSGDAGSGSTNDGKDPVSGSSSPSNSNNHQGAVQVDQHGAVYVVYNKQTESTASTSSVDDKLGTTPLTPLDVQDKPYYGSHLGLYFHDNRTDENNVSDSSENETNGGKGNGRRRRAANVAGAHDTSCAEPAQFQPCQYYRQCFHNLTDTCRTRDSFLGNVFSRFCSKAMETSRSVGSLLLSSYLRGMEMCIRQQLVKIVESPSCSEVTSTLQEALFLRRPESCLYQRETFCNVLADDVARPSLARMFNSTEDIQFKFRVMVNIANIAPYCRSQGASIFMTDITLLVTATDSPYRDLVGSTPIPGIVPKY
ncbi:hypothetical protein BsWGS_17640 [Bradybaena similaris]